MKRVVLYLLLAALCPCACFADLGDADDGFLTEGEYDYGVEIFGSEILIVEGGGADIIDTWDYSKLEVWSTSMPLAIDEGGVFDIHLSDFSSLLFCGGATETITIRENATATLKGGLINSICNRQYLNADEHIDLYCQDGWGWLFNTSSEIKGITGLWETGTAFTIDFIDDQDYDPVWMNINIIEIPEPATLLLITLGAALIRKR